MSMVPFLADGGIVIAGVAGIWLVFVGLAIVASIFWIWMLVDALTSNLPTTEKLLWVLVILFTHILGAVLYFAMVRSGRGTSRLA